jgi:ribosomal protein L11 methyltransferase
MSYDQWHGGDDSPVYVGSFAVTPPWKKAIDKRHVEQGRHHILLDPGVVFGTGLHPTTRDCLEAIELAVSRQMPEFVVDMGTGTGILALAAAKLAGCTTIAVDLNFLAVQTTLKNVMLNRLEDKIVPVQGSAENFVDYPADFMIANIHYDITRKILDSKGFYQKKRFLLSGLLKSEAKAVKDQLWQHDVELIKTWDQNGIWFTFFGEIH